MKNLLLLFLLSFSYFTAMAQYEVTPLSMSEGLHEAIVFTADAVDDRTVKKLWTDFIKEYHGDTNRNRKANEYTTLGANLIDLAGTVPVDIYFKVEEFGDNTRVYVWFRTNNSFINFTENPALKKSAEAFLDKFQLEVSKWRVNELLEEEEDQLSDLKSDLGKLDRLKSHYEDKIEKAKKTIEENKENIKKNEVEQEALKQNIEKQKEIVEKVRERLDNLKVEGQ